MTIMIPWGYGSGYKSLAVAKDLLLEHHHPEYVRRLIAWLASKNGSIGVGGTFRADGSQPDKPGFAPEGQSFHQNQKYSDGFIGACAVDLVAPNPGGVHRTVSWSQVLPQGSAEAKRWGLHCNVSSEPWHMQPIEIDGWRSWMDNGSPAPEPPAPTPDVPSPPMENDEMKRAAILETNNSYWVGDGNKRSWAGGGHEGKLVAAAGLIDSSTAKVVYSWSDVTPVSESWLNKYVGHL